MHDDTETPSERDRDDTTAGSAFSLLAHPRRRAAVRTLSTHGEPMTLADLADEVAERERDTRLPELSPETVQRVYLSLYHSHVPRLTEAGVAGYDQEGDLVWMRQGPATDRLVRLLETL
jgi:hypothetical protein